MVRSIALSWVSDRKTTCIFHPVQNMGRVNHLINMITFWKNTKPVEHCQQPLGQPSLASLSKFLYGQQFLSSSQLWRKARKVDCDPISNAYSLIHLH